MSPNNMLVAFLGAGGLVAYYLSKQATQTAKIAPRAASAATWGMDRLQAYLPTQNAPIGQGSGMLPVISSLVSLFSQGGGAPVPNNNPVRINQFGDIAQGFATILNGGQTMANAHTLTTGARLKSDLMRDFPLTSAQAAGVVGNLAYESNGFQNLQEIAPTVAGSRGGYGYAQWTGTRRRAFEAWSASKGLDPSSYGANYGFLKHELHTTERRTIPALEAQATAADAARVFSRVFLRPGIPATGRRVALANAYV